MRLKTILGGFVGITIVTLAGCGGGGGNNPDTSITLGGTATKGIIDGGNVVAEELNADGTVIARIGTATTAADGSYTLDVDNSYNGGPIQVTLGTDENSRMKCDVPSGCGTDMDSAAIDFGDWYKPGNVTMRALVASAIANDAISVNITPYTELATRRARATGPLTPAAVDNANSEVSDLLGDGGINILNTRPLDITDETARNGGNAAQVAYAALSAAIAIQADSSGGIPDINAALETLWNSFSDGTIVSDDTGTAADDSTISLQEIVNGATSVLNELGIEDTSNTFDSLQANIDTAPGGIVDPEPAPGAGDTPLAKVKAFVGDIRTWGTILEEDRENGEAFGTQVKLASTAADASTSLVIGPAIRSTIIAIFRRLAETTVAELGDDVYKTGVSGDPQFESGTITYSGGIITITDGVIDGTIINTSVQLPENQSTVASIGMTINSATLTSASTDLTITSGTIDALLMMPYVIDYEKVDMGTADVPDIISSTINLNVALTQKQDELGEALTSPVTFAGTLLATLVDPVKDTTGKITGFTPETVSLTGNISDTAGNSFDASLTTNLSNAGALVPGDDTYNWLVGNVGLNFMLQMDGLPKASVNVSGNLTAVRAGTATVTIVYGARQIVIVGAFSDILSTGSVTITNQDGVAMSIAGSEFGTVTGDITYNGQTYGNVERLNSGLTKITYTDDTFETL